MFAAKTVLPRIVSMPAPFIASRESNGARPGHRPKVGRGRPEYRGFRFAPPDIADVNTNRFVAGRKAGRGRPGLPSLGCAWRSLATSIVLALLIAFSARGAELAVIRLEEHLGAGFAPQVLHWVLELPRGKLKNLARCGLKNDQGAPVLAQVKGMDAWDDGSLRHVKISLISGLEPYQVKRFVVDDSGQKGPDDGTFTIATERDSVVLSSSVAAVRIPSACFADAEMPAGKAPPPISQIRGKTRWYGRGSMDSIQLIRQRRMSIADDGPIYKKASVEYTYDGGEKYVVEITLQRGEELVRVVEDFSLTFTEPSRSEFAFDLAAGLAPDRSVCKPMQKPGPHAWPVGSIWDLPYRGDMFPISYERDDTYGAFSAFPTGGQWMHFACYNSRVAGGDMVGIINTAPETWDHIAYVSRPDSWKLVQNPHMFFTLKMVKNLPVTIGAADKSLTVHFPLTTGHREWAFFVGHGFPLTDEVTVGQGDKAVTKTYNSGPRTYFVEKTREYFWNSLDRIKECALAWPADPQVTWPRLYGALEQWEQWRAKYNQWSGQKPIPPLNDPDNQQKIKKVLLKLAEDTTQRFLTNPGPPHHIATPVYAVANLADLVLGRKILSDEEEARLKARLAYFAYVMNWRAYWAPELGYAANPNMTSFCYDAVGLVGLLLADHPMSDTWIRSCTDEIDRELDHWVSKDGAWIESLHYVLAAWQEHTMLMAALKNLGVKDYYRDPRVRRFIEYYFAMQTPPDPEYNFQRSIACIGNSYSFEACREFGCWAKGMADVDRQYAGNLMWMWKQAGYGTPGEMKGKDFRAYGASYSMWFGAHLGLPPYHELALKDPSIPPIAPKPTQGRKFQGFGAVLNAHDTGPKETRLYFREGPYYSHWDSDQGSFVLWGKGAPLCMDHGYGEYHPWLHNRIAVNHLYDDSLGEVTGFFAGRGAGFVQGEITLAGLSRREHPGVKSWPIEPEPINGRSMATPWTRRVLMVKDEDPDGPNYLVVRDLIQGQLPAEWCLWVYGNVADFKATPIRAVGRFGVDLLVYLMDNDKGTVGTAALELPKDRRKQTLIHLKRPAGCGVLAVLYPTLPNVPPPNVATIGDNAGIKLAAGGRTDWVLMPERAGAVAADGITFRGTVGCYSRQAKAAYYMIDRNCELSTPELTVKSGAAVELWQSGRQIKGYCRAPDAPAVVALAGLKGIASLSLTAAGTSRTVAVQQGRAQIILPAGETEFEAVAK